MTIDKNSDFSYKGGSTKLPHESVYKPCRFDESRRIKGVDLKPTYEELDAIAAERFDTIRELEVRNNILLHACKGAIAHLVSGDLTLAMALKRLRNAVEIERANQ